MITVARSAIALAPLLAAGVAAQSTPAPDRVLEAMQLSSGTLQRLTAVTTPAGGYEVDVVLAGRRLTARLAPHDVRGPGYRLLVDDGRAVRHVEPAPPSTTSRGSFAGRDDSVIAASIFGTSVWLTARTGSDVWLAQPVPRALGLPASTHVVYRARDAHLPPGTRCGVPDPAGTPLEPDRSHTPDARKVAELAIDADYDYFRRNGSSVAAVQAAVTRVINSVNVIYQRDVDVQHEISTLLVRRARTYTSTDMSSLLRELQRRWNNSHTSVQRDAVQLFTGRGTFTGTVGIAFVGVLCNKSWGYAAAKVFAPNAAADTGLVAHELGHVWGAEHCDRTTPCNIMCASLGGCSADLTSFAPSSKAVMAAFRDRARCLESFPRGSFTPFGRGCRGSNGTPVHTIAGVPRVGAGGLFSVQSCAPNSTAWLVVGTSDKVLGSIRLPFDLAPFGAAGCLMYSDQILLLAGPTSFFGSRTAIVTFPSDPSLVGGALFSQFFCRDRAANRLGLTTSGAIKTTLGAPQ